MGTKDIPSRLLKMKNSRFRVVKSWKPRPPRQALTMRNTTKVVIVAVASAILAFSGAVVAHSLTSAPPPEEVPLAPKAELTHEQETWIAALEWCESRGKASAINPNDRDNTPSYGAYQFKPSTLTYYAELYDVATSTNGVMDYAVQREVVKQMVLHRDEIVWTQQFPDCVKNKIGLPPKGLST